MTTTAFAKINISLDVVSKMDDGYHNLLMVMQSISLGDEITVECTEGEGVSVETDLAYLPSDERNIAARAALAFFDYTGIKGKRTFIRIAKKIPVCAGLGGGSADGACVLRALDTMLDTRLGQKTLETIGSKIGSDIPFCIAGGTRLAEHRGDKLTDLPPIPKCHVVICKPSFAISTPELFGKIKCERIKARPDTNGIVEALGNGDLSGIARRMYNVFEDVLPRGARDIADIKYAMLDNGALGAVMTGTGSAVFGLFSDARRANEAHAALKAVYKECFIAETVEQLSF